MEELGGRREADTSTGITTHDNKCCFGFVFEFNLKWCKLSIKSSQGRINHKCAGQEGGGGGCRGAAGWDGMDFRGPAKPNIYKWVSTKIGHRGSFTIPVFLER